MTQVATAVVLLVGSGLMVRSARRLAAVNPGFDPHGLVTAAVTLGRQPDAARAAVFYHDVLDEMARLPGVESVGATSALPIAPASLTGSNFDIRSRPTPEGALPPFAMYVAVTAGYFETLGIPILQGRAPTWADTDAAPARRVGEPGARREVPGRSRRSASRFSLHEQWLEIVGVVGNVKTFDLREPSRAMVYLPMGNPAVPLDGMFTVVRTRDAAALPASGAPRGRGRGGSLGPADQRPDDGRDPGRVDGADVVHDGAAHDRGADGARARSRRPLRRHQLRRLAADGGDRHSPGARRATGRRLHAGARARDSSWRWRGSRSDWSRRRRPRG